MGRNPLYGFIAFLVVQGLIATGFISHEYAEEARLHIEEVIFYLFLAIMGLTGFYKYIDAHKHQSSMDADVKKSSPITTKTEDFSQKNTPLFTGEELNDSGTPPSI